MIVEDLARIGAEDVRPILVNQHPRVVVVIVGVPADVWASIEQQDPLVRLSCQAFGQHAAGEPGPHNQHSRSKLEVARR